jgi:hypothetical protein
MNYDQQSGLEIGKVAITLNEVPMGNKLLTMPIRS